MTCVAFAQLEPFAVKKNNPVMPKIEPHTPPFYANLPLAGKQKLYENAAALISDNKRQLFDRLASLRTRHIAVALEDVYQSHNAAAVCGE